MMLDTVMNKYVQSICTTKHNMLKESPWNCGPAHTRRTSQRFPSTAGSWHICNVNDNRFFQTQTPFCWRVPAARFM